MAVTLAMCPHTVRQLGQLLVRVTVWHEVVTFASEKYSPSRYAYSTKVAVLLLQCMMNLSSAHDHLSRLIAA